MTTVFTPQGRSVVLAYADDSTETSTLAGGATGWLVFNPDVANVVVVNFGFTDGDTDAVVPTSGANGKGTVIGPGQQVVLNVPQCAYAAQVYVSVAGVSGTGNVFLTPGTV
jgi:hypothetical protein